MSYSEYKEFVKDIIDYDILKQDCSKSDTQLVDAIVELMTEVAISDGDYITISGKKVPKKEATREPAAQKSKKMAIG